MLFRSGDCPDLELELHEYREHCMSFKIIKSIYDYNLIIISLYGSLECFIDNIIRDYLNYLHNKINSYNDLPKAIQDNHFHLSASLMQNLNMHKYSNLKKEAIVANLHSCFNEPDKYRINIDAYLQRTANLRQDMIAKMFARVGISNILEKIASNRHYIIYIKKQYSEMEYPAVSSKVHENKICAMLGELALRRNDVSHGVETEDILSNEILLDYVDFLSAYTEAVVDILITETLPYEVEEGVLLREPYKIFNNEIICVNLEKTPMKVGNTIIARSKSDHSRLRFGQVLEMKYKNNSIIGVTGHGIIDVGIKVDFNAKYNQEFILIQKFL